VCGREVNRDIAVTTCCSVRKERVNSFFFLCHIHYHTHMRWPKYLRYGTVTGPFLRIYSHGYAFSGDEPSMLSLAMHRLSKHRAPNIHPKLK